MIGFGKKNTKSEKKEEKSEMSFLQHLEELRWHIVRSVVAIVAFAIFVFCNKSFVFNNIIFGPTSENFWTYKFVCRISDKLCFSPPSMQVLPREFGEAFFVHLKVSFWLGLTIAFPYLFWEFWRFIKPGLYQKEKKAAKGIVLTCSLLFLTGILFGYYIIAPFAVNFLGSYEVAEAVSNSTSLASYVGYLTMFTIPTGIVFELPVVVYFLATIGLITSSFMKKYRKHAFIIILILASIITPPDAITQFLIGIPIFILYEISIIIAARVQKKQEQEQEQSLISK